MSNYVERIQKENDDYAKELQKLRNEVKIVKEALLEAAEYAGSDDVNGQAGEICLEVLNKLGWLNGTEKWFT